MEVVVRAISGLGNQLFQYAAGLYYAQRRAASLRLAIDQPQNQNSYGHPRPFLLSHFSIPVPMQPLSAKEKLLFSARPALRPAASLLRSLENIQILSEAESDRFHFLPDLPVRASTRTLFLSGYWQTFRIADAIEAALRRDLRFREPPPAACQSILDRIQASRSAVSLHVRRGDYTLAAEGCRTLPLTYYQAAIAHFRERLHDPTFFVFSDDIAFCRANLPADLMAVFVDHNSQAAAHEDLRLMSACHHHIIANSSFSWWGAWLNPRPERTVYAPRQWMLTPESFFPDLLPPAWIAADCLPQASSRP